LHNSDAEAGPEILCDAQFIYFRPSTRRQVGRKPCPSDFDCRDATVATSNPIELAAEIVTAYVARNSLPRSELSALFEAVHAAVARLAKGEERAPPPVEAQAPAVSIRKSITPDCLICLEDGKQFKS
jgi:hypothetical protein